MIWRYALLDFVHDLCRLVGAPGFEIISLGFCSLVHHELVRVSLATIKRYYEL